MQSKVKVAHLQNKKWQTSTSVKVISVWVKKKKNFCKVYLLWLKYWK